MRNVRSDNVLNLDEPVRKLLGARLREQRLARRLSAGHVATLALGLTQRHSSVLRLEQGQSPHPKQENLVKLAAFYGVTLEVLLDVSAQSAYRSPVAQAPLAVGNGNGADAQTATQTATEGEDLRHDPQGWTSSRARAPRYIGR
jgi:transcriptional regulator with XRE-family HTH domain